MSTIMNITAENINSPKKCRNYTISIVECGKIGVFHAILFAEAGFKVIGVSTDPHVFKLLKGGRSPFLKVSSILGKHVKEGSLVPYSDVRKAAAESDIIVVAVQTTIDRRKKPNYSLLEKTCREIAMGIRRGSLVLFVSATGPGIVENSMRKVLEETSGLKAGMDFGLASSPFQTNSLGKSAEIPKSSRVVGAVDKSSLEIAGLILNRTTKSEIAKVNDIKTAEIINLFQNMNDEMFQALVNEFAILCEQLKIDSIKVLRILNRNTRHNIPFPGIFSSQNRRDFYLLREEAENVNANLRLTQLARKINDGVANYTFHLIKEALKSSGKTVRRSKISVLGVSRCPDTKESPAVLTRKVVNLLKKKVRVVQIYDPFFSRKELTELGFDAEKLSKVVEKTDCLVILTGHSKFQRLNLKKIKLLAKKSPAIVDISHVVGPFRAEKYGFVYRGLGRGVWTK